MAAEQKNKRIRQKCYKRFLFTETELATHAPSIEPAILELREKWSTAQLPEAEVVARYILAFLNVFRARDYLGGPHSVNLRSDPHLELTDGVQIFARLSLRSVPLAVNRAIVGWAEGRYPLVLTEVIPSADQLLQLQATGKRVVTCLFGKSQLRQWVQGVRDPLGFVLHDLIHADHFFHDRDRYVGQVQFYQEVLQRHNSGEFSRLLASKESREKFEYIIADMNSHPAHLRGCLAQLERTCM